MNRTALRSIVAQLICAASLSAAPLTENTSVYAQADTAAPVITTLSAGTEPVLTISAATPAGWKAISLVGPHEVYVANKDVTKALDVRVGAPYLADANSTAPVLAVAEKNDRAEIIDYRGKWTKFRLHRPLTGYIKTKAITPVPTPSPSPAVTSTPVKDRPTSATPAQPIVNIGKAAPTGDGASSSLPRLFQGKFATTYNPMRPRRPYDYQVNDESGARYAYVDVSKLLATEQLTKFIDRTILIYGTAKPVPGTQDMVIVAESLQLR